MCGYLVRRQDRPILTKVEKASVKERIAEIRSNWQEGGYNCTNYAHWYYPKYRTIVRKVVIQGPVRAIKITNYDGLKKGEGLEKTTWWEGRINHRLERGVECILHGEITHLGRSINRDQGNDT